MPVLITSQHSSIPPRAIGGRVLLRRRGEGRWLWWPLSCPLVSTQSFKTRVAQSVQTGSKLPIKDPVKRREYQKRYHRQWYEKHKKERRADIQQRKKNLREWFRELKEGMSCEICGISGKNQAWVLEFHHIEPADKKEMISYMVGAGYSKKRILAEIKKCVVICANDHRAKHFKEFMEAKRNGEDDPWTAAGRAGARDEVLFPNSRGTQRQERRKRSRRDRRRLRNESANPPGPKPEVDSRLDSLLRKVELGKPLDPKDAATLRRLTTGRHDAMQRRTSQWDDQAVHEDHSAPDLDEEE